MNKKIYLFLTIMFWIIIWQILGLIVGNEIFLATPYNVLLKLLEMIKTLSFWSALLFSFIRIVLGFILGVLTGLILGGLAYKSRILKEILWSLISIIKAAPIVSFIILFLILISSRNLSVLISYLMVVPIIYTNVLKGFENADIKLLEMAKVFRIKSIKKILYIYVPSLFPFFYSGCQISLGLCWKSGVTAELIGTPTGSIGERLYQAKLYLNTGELFAWTFVIIIISILFEKIFLKSLKKAMIKFERS